MPAEYLQTFDRWLEARSTPLSVRVILASGSLSILLLFAMAAYALNISFFTPDSWAYYELAQTIFGGDFYVFNTWRSYVSDTHSVSFPFAYPVALAFLHQVFGASPLAAIWMNVFLVAVVWLLSAQQAIRMGVPALTAIVISTGLVLWPPYMTEVFAGRSIPLALLWIVLALTCYQGSRPLLGGVCLGLAALTRFDYLVVSILFVLGMTLLDPSQRRNAARWVAGLVIGASPWIAFSLLHFGRFWASDNSWVALSASPAFVTDYPASAVATAFDAPGQWLLRVFGNVPGLLGALYSSMSSFPPILGLLLLVPLAARHMILTRLAWSGLALVLAGASLAPYLLTGYFDQRYFSAFLLLSCYVVALSFSPDARPVMQAIMVVALLGSLLTGGADLGKAAWGNYQRIQAGEFDRNAWLLEAIQKCHILHPDSTLIFLSQPTFAARYGATTGMKAALLPENFARMSQEGKQAYLAYMQPYLVMDDSFQEKACNSNGQ